MEKNNGKLINKSNVQKKRLLFLDLPILIREDSSCNFSPFHFQQQYSKKQLENILVNKNIFPFSKQNEKMSNQNNYFIKDLFNENPKKKEEIKKSTISKKRKKNFIDKEQNLNPKKIKKIKLKKIFSINTLTLEYLLCIFFNKQIELKDLEELNLKSKSFIFLILLRKMKLQKKFIIFQMNFRENNIMKEKIDQFRNYSSGKRFLENFSLVFKYFINYQKKYLKKNDEKIIYHYFNKISIEKTIDIKKFSDPSKKLNPMFKNFSRNYLKYIIESSLFKKDFIYFLKFVLIEDYFINIEKKFLIMLSTIEEKLIKKMGKNETYDEKIFHDYFVKNKQCKLPWCKSELEKAIKDVFNEINH